MPENVPFPIRRQAHAPEPLRHRSRSNRSRSGPASAAAVAGLGLVALLAALAAPAQTPDPPSVDAFYIELLELGRTALRTGDPEAARLLRIACFGLLDAPDRLAGCLVQLALAHAADDEDDAFVQTTRRLAEVERRFGGYRAARLEPAVEAAFIEQLASRAPTALLASVPAWKAAAILRRARDLASLDPAARRAELEQLHALEPEEPRWRRELAAMVLSDDDAQQALALLTPLSDAAAACVRGVARARLGDCTGADEEALVCGPSAPEQLWRARLDCLTAIGAWRAAAGLHAQLPPALQAGKPYRRMGREIARQVRRLPDPPPEDGPTAEPTAAETGTVEAGTVESVVAAPAADAPGDPPADAGSDTAVRIPVESVPTSDERIQSVIARSRQALLGATSEATLLAVLADAEALARRLSDPPELLLHIAEIHYRLRNWHETVLAVQASGLDLDDRPTVLFYYAVALFETGQRSAAASALERAWPHIRQTEFVRAYALRILGRIPP